MIASLATYDFLGEGKTAEVYALDKQKVAKLFFPKYGEEPCNREAEIVQDIDATGVPAPKYFGRTVIEDRPGLIFERILARPSLAIVKSKPWLIKYYAKCLAQIHHQIHSHSLKSSRLISQSNKLQQQLKTTEKLLEGRADKISTYLKSLPTDHKICHGEFHLKNLLCAPKRMVAIDWTNAYTGHHFSDIAITVLRLQSPYIPEGIAAFKIPFFRWMQRLLYLTYVKEYRKVSGNRLDGLDKWFPAVAPLLLTDQRPEEYKWLLNLIDQHLPS